MGCAGAGNGIFDTGGSLTFSGFASGEMKICNFFRKIWGEGFDKTPVS